MSDLPSGDQTAPFDPLTADRSVIGTGPAAGLTGEAMLAGSVIVATGVEIGAAKAVWAIAAMLTKNKRITTTPPAKG